jgi:hypothetical protein
MKFTIEVDQNEHEFTKFEDAVEFLEERFGTDNLESLLWEEVKEEKSFYELEAFLDDFYYDGIPDVFCYLSAN